MPQLAGFVGEDSGGGGSILRGSGGVNEFPPAGALGGFGGLPDEADEVVAFAEGEAELSDGSLLLGFSGEGDFVGGDFGGFESQAAVRGDTTGNAQEDIFG